MRHLVRAGILLAILLANLFALRRVSTPSLFAQYDLVLSSTNAEENAERWASRPIQYRGPSDCSECHPDKFTQWGRSRHYVVNCETCHGPGEEHLRTGARLTVESSPTLCKGCHGRVSSRPGDFPQVDTQQHAGNWTCVNCHNPHEPEAILQERAQRATAPEVAHGLEGREDCLACHAAPAAMPFPEDHAGRTNDLCLGCHPPLMAPPAASQTPILAALTASFPRIPHRLEGRSNCLLCHDPEGFIPFPEDHTGRTNDMCRTCHKGK